MNRHIRWLAPEVRKWVDERLIDAVQGDAILRRYPSPDDAIPWGKIIFSSIGAILAGLGVILLFAYNWDAMPKWSKLAVIFLSLAATHGAGFLLGRSGAEKRPLREGLHLLGTMLFGAGIWLIAQIYHMDAHYPNAFLAWGLGALVLAWALPSAAQGILATLLLAIWSGVECAGFNHPHPAGPLLLLAGVAPLAWMMRSRVLLGVWLPAFLVSVSISAVAVEDDLLAPVLLFTAGAVVGLGALARRSRSFPGAAPVLTVMGFVPYLGVLYALTFPEGVRDLSPVYSGDPLERLYFWIPLAAAVVSWVLALRGNRKPDEPERPGVQETAVLAALLLFGVWYLGGFPGFEDWVAASVFNLLFLAHAVLMIREGPRQARMAQTVAGCLLFSLLAFTRYIDLFDSLIARGLVFLAVGIALFITGSRYARSKNAAAEKAP